MSTEIGEVHVNCFDACAVVSNDTSLPKHKYSMRFYEIKTIKPIQPLTPSAARIRALKQSKDRAADALTAERDRHKRGRPVFRVIYRSS